MYLSPRPVSLSDGSRLDFCKVLLRLAAEITTYLLNQASDLFSS